MDKIIYPSFEINESNMANNTNKHEFSLIYDRGIADFSAMCKYCNLDMHEYINQICLSKEERMIKSIIE